MKPATEYTYMTGQLTRGNRPAAVGEKFSPTGQVLPFGGNTFICHIPPASPAHKALVDIQDLLRAEAPTGTYTYLPAASLHMTVFEGVCDAHRDPDSWPKGMDPALPVSAVTRIFSSQFKELVLPAGFRIAPVQVFAGLSVLVTGASPADGAALQSARDLLRHQTGIQKSDFASYMFHISLAYLLRWLTPDEALLMRELSELAFARLWKLAPVIPIGAPEFCQFDDMHAFHPVLT
jgi:hypothetical protein